MNEKQRILAVDDTPANLKILHTLLRDEYNVSVATNGADALKFIESNNRPDLILLDVMMPEMDGYEVCRRLKENPKTEKIPVLFVTAKSEVEDEAHGLSLGAVDYITKPINPAVVKSRVQTHMSLHLHREKLEELVQKRTQQLKVGYMETIQRLVLASEYKDAETGNHISRVSYYAKELASELGMDSKFVENIFHAAPMHDIGKVAIPDSVLLKKGPLDEDEWNTMKTHAHIGGKILEGSDSPYLKMGAEIASFHHERWDGGGYPEGLKGDEIPLTARIMNIADQYDALRSPRPYKPGFDHEKTFSIITEGDGRTMPEHFDPQVLEAFKRAASRMNDIFEEHEEE